MPQNVDIVGQQYIALNIVNVWDTYAEKFLLMSIELTSLNALVFSLRFQLFGILLCFDFLNNYTEC